MSLNRLSIATQKKLFKEDYWSNGNTRTYYDTKKGYALVSITFGINNVTNTKINIPFNEDVGLYYQGNNSDVTEYDIYRVTGGSSSNAGMIKDLITFNLRPDIHPGQSGSATKYYHIGVQDMARG